MKLIQRSALILVIALTICISGFAQEKKVEKDLFIASTIPDSLKEEANAITRYGYTEYTLKSPGKLAIKHHEVVTILNEKADAYARMALFYNKFNSVNSAEMIVYNAAGMQIKKYRKSDLYDHSASDGFSIVTDERVMIVGHAIASYPITIEKTYEVTRNSYLDMGTWHIQADDEAVQNETVVVKVNPEVGFRYQNKNTAVLPVKGTEDGLETYTWAVKNLKAIKTEEDAVSWRALPRVDFVANKFVYGGIAGDFSNWQNYGKWQFGVNADVCSLSPAREAEIQAMTADIKTDKAKVKFLYEYLQRNMRYVSISLGIGGLKPFPASFVDEKKYGDCKALSNYMYALLKAVHIPSYYAMINAGENEEPADEAFPTDPFNHIVLCVPLKGDTTWLECTSNTKSFGKLGAFTENRNALLITEEGGKLVHTPRSKSEDNRFDSEVHIVLDNEGGAKAKVKILSTGGYRDSYIGLASLKTDEQNERLIRMMRIKQPNVINYSPVADIDGVKEVALTLEFDKFSDMGTASKMFYRPRVFDIWQLTIPEVDKRKYDYYFDEPLQKSCVTTIELPEGFEVETLPASQSLKFTYGNYDVNYVYNAAKNQVISTAKFNLTNHVIPATKYSEMQQYMDSIAKAQNKKLVIKRKA